MKFVGERRAIAATVFAFYTVLYLGLLLLIKQGYLPPELAKMVAAIAGVYFLAFFALVAGYFWARWYSVGVGLYGVMSAVVGAWQMKPGDRETMMPILIFMGVTHGIAALTLWGDAMSAPYDGQTAWREKFHMDENAVQRLGRAVIRAGASLPLVLAYAFAPKPGGAELAVSLAALVLTAAGMRGLVQLKTWGLLAIGGAATLMLGMASADLVVHGASLYALRPALAGALLLAATAPFASPMMRWVAAR